MKQELAKKDNQASTNSIADKSLYEIKSSLFKEALNIKNELSTVADRLQKMIDHKANVSADVFAKVQHDYNEQKKSIQKNFESKRKEVSKELLQLYGSRKENEAQLATLKQVLEEAQFRHFLGEYSDDQFKNIEQEQGVKITVINDTLDVINNSVSQYEELIGGVAPPEATSAARPTIVETPQIEVVAQASNETAVSEIPPAASEPINTDLNIKIKDSSDFDQLDDELDLFLESAEGDYFNNDNKAKVENEPKEEVPVAPPASTKTTKRDIDDSLSSILRSIPLDEAMDDDEDPEISEISDVGSNPTLSLDDENEAKMILIDGELDESEITLGDNTSIGRSPSNDIVLREPKISRQHAAINLINGNYVIVDLKSSNGIMINAKKVEEQILKNNDIVQIGSYQFKFVN